MSGQYTKAEVLSEEVFRRKAAGETNREIGARFGLSKEQVKGLVSRQSRKQRLIANGYVPFALEPVNTSAEPRKALLTALETGSGLTFDLIHADAEATRYSRDDRLYAAQAERWMDTVKSAYAEYAAFMQGKQALCIRDHTVLAESVRRTVYEDGSYVIVNYGDTPYTADGVTVAPLSYVTGKEAQ